MSPRVFLIMYSPLSLETIPLEEANTRWSELDSQSKQKFYDQAHYYRDPKARARVDSLTILERLCIALHRMGTTGEDESVARMYGREQTVVAQCVDQFCSAICEEYREEVIKLPDAEQCKLYMKEFWDLRGIPGCVGAMDGKHWLTCMGAHDSLAFKDFHGNFSLTMLGMVNARYLFFWISDFWAGATHDTRCWSSSTILDTLFTCLLLNHPNNPNLPNHSNHSNNPYHLHNPSNPNNLGTSSHARITYHV
jgi:hypothetical protein